MKSEQEIIKEIYWIFRNAIHNGHTQIKSEDGKVSSLIPIKDTSCYVCNVLQDVEREIAVLFDDNKYYTTLKVDKKYLDAISTEDTKDGGFTEKQK